MSKKITLLKLKKKEREARKNLIIDAAGRLFSSLPFNKVSMRDIAEEAGMATSSIYTYFPNQEALFLETLMRDTNYFINELNTVIDKTKKGQVLDKTIDAFIEHISRNESYFRMMTLFSAQGELSDNSFEKFNFIMRRALDSFERIFKTIRCKEDSRKMSHLFFATLNGIMVTYKKYPGHSDEEIVNHMKSIGKIFGNLLKLDSQNKYEKKEE